MTDQAIKVCSHCGAEYDASAQVCADCGARLVFRTDDYGDVAPLAEDEAQVLVREGAVGYLRELAREFAAQGIRSAIVFHAPAPGT
jgi:predicted amidophosphoribosyltransferase